MALTKIITDTIDLSSDTTGLKMPKGTTDQRPDVLTVDYLVVGGGGAGASAYGGVGGGGGGAGGLRTSYPGGSGGGGSSESTLSLRVSTAYTIDVGIGGSGSAYTDGNIATDAGNSTFASITSEKGGNAKSYISGGTAGQSQTGGSGGGGVGWSSITPGNGTINQGYDGGAGQTNSSTPYRGGGGGGAGSAGVASLTSGNGGDGLQVNIDGLNNFYAAGGGGGAYTGAGTGGSSIGGNGGANNTSGCADGTAGATNTGSGGGGGVRSGGASCGVGGDGSDGIIILRVASTTTATFSAGVTSTLTQVGGGAWSSGDKVYTITSTSSVNETVTFTDSTLPPVAIGTTRENTTTGKMEIYTGAKGWRALQQTGQDVGVVPSNNFNAALYTGNATNNSVDIGFDADLTWIKNRTSAGSYHILFDTTRGLNEVLHSDNDLTQQASGMSNSYSNGILSFSGSYTWGNKLNDNYVAWGWKAGGSSNTFNIDGVGYATAAAAGMNTGTNPPSACSVNTELGFSIIKNTSPSGAYTWDHGLNKAPELWIHKTTDYVNYGWETMVPSASLWGNSSGSLTPADWLYLRLDLANATSTNTFYSANDTLLSSGGWGQVSNFITYAWHSVPGYSLIGTYTGTENADFPIIYTGFEPAWLMIKRIDSTGDWYIWDDKRSTSNLRLDTLDANTSDAELLSTGIAGVRFLNNGFQVQSTYTFNNAEGGDYIFMCFAS